MSYKYVYLANIIIEEVLLLIEFVHFLQKHLYLHFECLFDTEKWLINQNFKMFPQDKRLEETESSAR